jgi:hypothetical protein
MINDVVAAVIATIMAASATLFQGAEHVTAELTKYFWHGTPTPAAVVENYGSG